MNSVKYLLFYMELFSELFILWHVWRYSGVLWVNSYGLVLHFQTPPGSHAWVSRHCYPIGCVIKSTHQGICSCSPIVNFLEITFYHGMVTSVIFLIKINLNRHIKHENLLSIYENVDYFQIMLFIVTCWKFQKTYQPFFYVFFSTNIMEILLKLRADASSGSGTVKAFLQGSSSPSPSPSPSPSSSSSSLLFSIFAWQPKDLDNHKDTHFHKGFQAHWMWMLFKKPCRFSWA